MSDSVVAIVGRPNTGKSTLFNRLIGKRTAIVEEEAGVTRDRIYGRVTWQNKEFSLVDTGGIDTYSQDIMKEKIKHQAKIAIEEADLIIFVVDGREGMTAVDREIANILRKTNKQILLVVNKVEDFSKQEEMSWDFYNLGLGEPLAISAEHGKNIGDLLDRVIDNLPEVKDKEDQDVVLDVAIIGKPNVGKSSLINYLVGQERVIVSDTPGTTRDAIDTVVQKDGLKYNLIDTAGLRKKARVEEDVEYYSNIRAIRAIERSDGVLMMLDGTQKEIVTSQDKKIAGYAHDEGKAIVLAVNKWDLVDKKTGTLEWYQEEIYYEMKFLTYAPITFISAKTGKRMDEVLDLMEFVIDQNSRRVNTSILNEVIEEAVEVRQPSVKKGKRLKLYYATQTGIKPPRFVFFVNDPNLMHFSYKRYLENVLRKKFGFMGSPLKFDIKERS
ncbi:MAG: ribosome biogenesis GTPase Der [Halanaerobiaceae bacterium]